jgi:hypothetical protein
MSSLQRYYIVTNMTIAWQRLAKHVPERYAVNKDRRPLLDNGFGYHGITSVSDTETVLEPLKAVIYVRFCRNYKRRPLCQTSQWVSRRRVISQPQELINEPATVELLTKFKPHGRWELGLTRKRWRRSMVISLIHEKEEEKGERWKRKSIYVCNLYKHGLTEI